MFTLFILLAGGAFTAGAEVAVLRGIRYAAGDTLSRVTLTMEGIPRYTGSLEGTTVRLGLSGARIGPSPGESMFKFRDGLVRSVSLIQCPGDSVDILVVMREPARYRIVRSPSGNGLQVLAFKPLPERVVQVVRPPVPLSGIGGSRAVFPLPFVDIPSIAREQIEELPPAVTPGKASPPAIVATPSPMIGMVLIGLTMLGGFVLLYLMLFPRRAGSQSRVQSRPAAATAGPVGDTEALAVERFPGRTHPEGLPETLRSRHLEEPPADEDQDEESYQMARSFSRGREEVLLARKFQEAPTITQHRITRVVSDDAGTSQRTAAARKLGVGRGEVDLAVRLKGLQNGRTMKEEVL
jgi:hypothetical protein